MVGVVGVVACGPTPINCCDFELRVSGLWLRKAGSDECCHCQQERQKYLKIGCEGWALIKTVDRTPKAWINELWKCVPEA